MMWGDNRLTSTWRRQTSSPSPPTAKTNTPSSGLLLLSSLSPVLPPSLPLLPPPPRALEPVFSYLSTSMSLPPQVRALSNTVQQRASGHY
eukprot:1340202-Rhodomonas_salina.3